ncbi:MAG: ABC transporter permease subunit [Bacilli bacterium]|nr:ABC transporter permease subunit [Bacilli bacterium]MDY0064242.1 ABC transporter permease subunit [Bacilli bacterium]
MINRVIFMTEFRRSFKPLLGWILGVGITMLLIILLYPLAKDIYQNLPTELLDFMEQFGGGLPDDVLEYFATEGAMIMQICGAIYASLLGYQTISREEREKTVDHIYVLPLSRTSFFFSKLIFVYVQIMLFSLGVSLLTALGFLIINDFARPGIFFLFMMGMNNVLLFMIASLGVALACFNKKAPKSMLALAIPLPLYVFYTLSTLTDKPIWKNFKYVTPFTFSDPIELLKSDFQFEWISFSIFLVLTVSLLVISFILYRKKEFVS